MKPSLIIFDNDGVLVDSEPLIKQAQIAAFSAQGAHITAEWSYANLHGLRTQDVLQKVSEYTGANINAEACITEFKKIITELFQKHLKPTPGVLNVLAEIQALGIPFCVATSGPLEETYLKLDICGLDKFFHQNSIFSGEQVKNGKPAPDLFLFAAKNMQVNPTDCVVIEDAPFGVRGARAAGMQAYGYMGGSHIILNQGIHDEELIREGASAVFHDHSQLLKVIGLL